MLSGRTLITILQNSLFHQSVTKQWRNFSPLHCCVINTKTHAAVTSHNLPFSSALRPCVLSRSIWFQKPNNICQNVPHLLQKQAFSTSTKDCSARDKLGKMYARREAFRVGRNQAYQKFAPARFVNAAPESIKPYLQLARVDKPIGTWLLYLPCAFSICLAASPGSWPDFYYLGLFGLGAFLMRGAGCVINDLWDKDLDKHVKRTKDRPLASGKLKPKNAIALLAVQLSLSLGILLSLNTTCIMIGVAAMIPVIFYPLAKRFTYYPQAVLGITFNVGAVMGYAAVTGSINYWVVGPLYLGCFFWTMYYDTIYAMQDVMDDALIGIKSTALLFSTSKSDELKKLPISERLAAMGKQKEKLEIVLTIFHLFTMTSWIVSFSQVEAANLIYVLPVLNLFKMMPADHGLGESDSLWEKFISCKKIMLYVLFGVIFSVYLAPPQSNEKSENKSSVPIK